MRYLKEKGSYMKILLSHIIRLISFDLKKHPVYLHLQEAKKRADLGHFNEVKRHLNIARDIVGYLFNAAKEESQIKGPLGDRAKKRFQILFMVKKYIDQAQEKNSAQRDTEINPLIDYAAKNLEKLLSV